MVALITGLRDTFSIGSSLFHSGGLIAPSCKGIDNANI